jgi:hypothetical protein
VALPAALVATGAADPLEVPPPSRIDFADFAVAGVTGTGTGRFIALLASCSVDIAWYISTPTNEMNL